MTIGELARRAGVRTSTLRYYEEIDLVRPARRVSGRRRYGPDALERMRVVQLAQRSGFTLAEIRVLMADFDRGRPSRRWKAMARAKLEELDSRADRIDRMRGLLREGIECDCLDLSGCALLAGSPDGI